jgi:hypothetical protein
MVEKRYKYTAKIRQPQTVVDVKLDPKGGALSEREYKTVNRDAYGASLLEKGLLIVEEVAASKPAPSGATGNKGATGKGAAKDNANPDSDAQGSKPPHKD